MELSEICHSFQITAALSFPEHGSVTTETSLYTSLWSTDRFQLYNCTQLCGIFVRLLIFLSTCLPCPHGVHGQSNPGIVDYSDAFPIIKFRNFVFVGILTSRQLDWSTANKWTQIAQWNSAHLELLMGVRWVYVLTLEPHNIWICCNSCIRAISSGLQNGLYSAVQWVRSLYTCTELQGRCCS